jgi:hypothetical protein
MGIDSRRSRGRGRPARLSAKQAAAVRECVRSWGTEVRRAGAAATAALAGLGLSADLVGIIEANFTLTTDFTALVLSELRFVLAEANRARPVAGGCASGRA